MLPPVFVPPERLLVRAALLFWWVLVAVFILAEELLVELAPLTVLVTLVLPLFWLPGVLGRELLLLTLLCTPVLLVADPV